MMASKKKTIKSKLNNRTKQKANSTAVYKPKKKKQPTAKAIYTKKPKPKNKGGAPSTYDKKFCKSIIEYFKNKQPYTTENTMFGPKLIPNRLPTLEGFAESIGTTPKTLWEWKNRHNEFSKAYTRAKAIYKDFLVTNGLLGLYNPAFAKFVAINTTELVDKKKLDLGIQENLVEGLKDKKNDELLQELVKRKIIR